MHGFAGCACDVGCARTNSSSTVHTMQSGMIRLFGRTCRQAIRGRDAACADKEVARRQKHVSVSSRSAETAKNRFAGDSASAP